MPPATPPATPPMPATVPTPVAAVIGLVPTLFDGARRLPGKALSLPIVAISSALAVVGTARREYDELAERGEQLIAKLRGVSLDDVEDQLEDLVEGTPFEAAYERLEDAGEDLVDAAGEAVEVVTARAESLAEAVTAKATAARESLVDTAIAPVVSLVREGQPAASPEPPVAEQPKGAPTPKATEPDSSRIDTAATPDVVETVEAIAARIVPDETLIDKADLPLPDYDHMTLGSLRGRLRSLDVEQLVVLRGYEKAHADRLPVVTMLDNRIAKLALDASTLPAAGG